MLFVYIIYPVYYLHNHVKVKVIPWHAYDDTKKRQRHSSYTFTT